MACIQHKVESVTWCGYFNSVVCFFWCGLLFVPKLCFSSLFGGPSASEIQWPPFVYHTCRKRLFSSHLVQHTSYAFFYRNVKVSAKYNIFQLQLHQNNLSLADFLPLLWMHCELYRLTNTVFVSQKVVIISLFLFLTYAVLGINYLVKRSMRHERF